jgi:nucleotide-binding universal stress UspA family protein
LDGSQRAESVLPIAIKLAEYHGAQLVLAHVIMQPEMLERTPLSTEDTQLLEEVVSRNEKKAKNYLDDLKQRLPVAVETKLLVGEDATVVLHDFVRDDGVDLVILNAHGRSGNQQRPYGNLVTNFITYGATPLLIFQDLSLLEPTEARVMEHENLNDTRPLTAPVQSQPYELA